MNSVEVTSAWDYMVKNKNYTGTVIDNVSVVRTFKDGLLHDYKGEPAVVYPSGLRKHFKKGDKHNACGPAIICSDGSERFFLNGVEYIGKELWEREAREIKMGEFLDGK